MIEITIIRHAETELNAAQAYQGTTDAPVGKRGMVELRKARTYPDVKRVFSSPMLRARQTTDILFPNAKIVLIEDLREMDFGDFEGVKASEINTIPGYQNWIDGGLEASCPNGESMLEFGKRALYAFDSVVEQTADGEKVYVVAHGGVIKALMIIFSRGKGDYFTYHIDNLHGYSITLDINEWKDSRKIQSINEYSAINNKQ